MESIAARGALDPDLDIESAADVLWALNHPGLYQLLVGERGWTLDRYESWLAASFCRELLAKPG